MLNRICIQGRLVKDPDVRNTSNQTAFCGFQIACERPFKGENGKAETDFINIMAWRQTATFVGNYFHKGDMILVQGRLQTRSYEKDGNKVIVTEVVADEINFCGSPKAKDKPAENPAKIIDNNEPLPFEV